MLKAAILVQSAMNSRLSVEDFLEQLCNEQIPISLLLINNTRLHGQIIFFSDIAILLEKDGQKQLIYIHAISAILPLRQV